MRKGHRVKCSWCGITIAYGERDASHGICAACVERISGSQALSSEPLHALPCGVMGLDSEGIIRTYARGEDAPVGRPRPAIYGRSFFWDVAASSRVRESWGRFLELCAAQDAEPVAFDFTLAVPDRPVRVRVRMSRAEAETVAEFPDVAVWVVVDARDE